MLGASLDAHLLLLLCLIIGQIISCYLASLKSVLVYYLSNKTQFLIAYLAV